MGDLDFLQALAPSQAPQVAREAARRRLQADIAAEATRPQPARRPRFAWRPKAAAAAVTAAVVVAAAVSWVLVQAPQKAEAALEQLATAVERIPPDEFPSGALLYTRSEQQILMRLPGSDLPRLGVEEFALLLPQTREVWLAPDGSIRLRTTTGSPTFFDEATAAAAAESGLPAFLGIGATVTETYPPSPDRIDPAAWPTDPGRLEESMRAEATRRGPQELPMPVRLLNIAAGLLRETGAQPALRAAVLHVLARTEGLTVTAPGGGGVVEVSASYRDEVGRWTTSIEFDAAGNLASAVETAVDGIPAASVPPDTVVLRATYQPTTVIPEASG